MTFADDLSETIQQVRAEMAKAEQERRDFDAKWNALREDTILPMLKAAAEVITRESRRETLANLHNGSVFLKVGWRRGHDFHYSLTLSPDREVRQIKCSSSFESDPGESFTLDTSIMAEVENRIKRFVRAIEMDKEQHESKGGAWVA
ncbi:MAG TPA: hypothetical protein VOA87_01700 [Thermoanaerobaculia bacterium]|nr:hypothetical protein [Thermoanaerobaculia bacterium]